MEILEAINIEEYEGQVCCPQCNQTSSVSFKKIAAEELIECVICGQKIKLVDIHGATRKFMQKVNKLLNNLDRELDHFSHPKS